MRAVFPTPLSFVQGGPVHRHDQNLDPRYLRVNKQDTVLARLMPGEIVIPVRHAGVVKRFLRQQHIHLPHC